MQCPNCRKVEKGNWRFANGYRAPPDVNIDEWTNDEDLYDPGYSEIVQCLTLSMLPIIILINLCSNNIEIAFRYVIFFVMFCGLYFFYVLLLVSLLFECNI